MPVTQQRNCITCPFGILACEQSWQNRVVKIQDEDLVHVDDSSGDLGHDRVVAAAVVVVIGGDDHEVDQSDIVGPEAKNARVAQNGDRVAQNDDRVINDQSRVGVRADLIANHDHAAVDVRDRRSNFYSTSDEYIVVIS